MSYIYPVSLLVAHVSELLGLNVNGMGDATVLELKN